MGKITPKKTLPGAPILTNDASPNPDELSLIFMLSESLPDIVGCSHMLARLLACEVCYVRRCWVLMPRGHMSGNMDFCACWLNACALNGSHNILFRLCHCYTFGAISMFLLCLPMKWYHVGLLVSNHPIPLPGLVVAFEVMRLCPFGSPSRRCKMGHTHGRCFLGRGALHDLWTFFKVHRELLFIRGKS